MAFDRPLAIGRGSPRRPNAVTNE